MTGPIKILLIDDHQLVRRGLAQLIEQQPGLQVCAEAGTPGEALEALNSAAPDVLVLDISLGEHNGISLIRDLRDQGWRQPILVLSMHGEALYAERVLKAGANGYIMKEKGAGEMISAIKRVAAGNTYLSEAMYTRILAPVVGGKGKSSRAEAPPIHGLTNREFEILEFIGSGVKTSDIAAELNLSVKTVETHRANIKSKLGLKNSIELLQYATEYVQHDSY